MKHQPIPPHPQGAQPPAIPSKFIPKHIAVVMDGNGRWANERGLPRTEGHKAGEASLMEVIYGSLEMGVEVLSAYAFSTENWKRSPEEVRFLMGFNRDVIRRRVDELDALGVRMVWSGREGRLWRSVIKELEVARERTKNNTRMTLQFCVNYGGRAEILDAVNEITREVAQGKLKPGKVTAKSMAARLYAPDLPDVDLFLRSSGEQRTSNFLLWQSAYAELVFQDVLWPDVDRTTLWRAIEEYASRDRRFGGAVDKVAGKR
ncbi:isoprenyl transferase [Brevibacterium sp. HMSC22B09]|uniref:isoprenyl transferase n=1 Tax=Brevibacterium sp. HMSC22B09 TaxID=1581055 RepID=UPI0008A59E7E|nr:isoprenyl transferase [Brevibacterium sp. HMSC22B09]OFT99574.1 isoprenyl transferase [Brevibacterium sp. HMSC22B09]